MSLRLLLFLPALLLLVSPVIDLLQLSDEKQQTFEQRVKQLTRTSDILARQIEANSTWLSSLDAMGANADGRDIFSHKLTSKITTDGRSTEWQTLAAKQYDANQALEVYSEHPGSEHLQGSLSYDLTLGKHKGDLYFFLEVIDDQVIYREINNLSVHRNDHIEIALLDDAGLFQRYTLATHQPGSITAFVTSQSGRALRRQPDISGTWRATDAGYNIEVVVPARYISNRFSLTVADVDDPHTRLIKTVIGSASTAAANDLGTLILPTGNLKDLLASYSTGWVVLTGTTGQILASSGVQPIESSGADYSASSPITQVGKRLGSISITESDPSIQRLFDSKRALILIQGSGIFVLGLLFCWAIGRIIQNRLSRLRQQFESAIDIQGRVQHSLPQTNARDEIGDLSRSLADIVERLRQYNHYLEAMASRLAHELRTPVSVVRSSLENLDENSLPDDQKVYVERAGDGVKRLTNILNKMSEATRLEQSLDEDEVEKFNLAEVVSGCVEGYKLAYPDYTFAHNIEISRVPLTGIPELIAQLLDKLISNAVEFSQPDNPILIRLTSDSEMATLRILNDGPSLPSEMSEKLFDSMISIRKKTTAEGSHLGLGLYIAKIITEFHGGSISAHDREDTQGVMIKVTLPLLRLTTKLKS